MYNRKSIKYINRDDLYFSKIYGKGIYCWNDEWDYDPVDSTGQRELPVFMNVNTEERFLVKKVYWIQNMDEYEYAIRNAPKTDSVIWPVDIVELNHDDVTEVFMEPDYDVKFVENERKKDTNTVILYPTADYDIIGTVGSVLREITGKLSQTGKISFQQEKVRELIPKILKAIKDLNEDGYLCLDFDFDRMLLTEDGRVLFEYSHLIVRDKEKFSNAPDYVMDKGEYKLDFAQPRVIIEMKSNPKNRKDIHPNRNMQNYSLTAMLFFLMVGRYPYDGALMAGSPDTNEIEHFEKFDKYHWKPVFIFDEKDHSNALGTLGSDKKYIERWKQLPKEVQKCFQYNLSEESARSAHRRSRATDHGMVYEDIPGPDFWLAELNTLYQN